ncbi:PAS domain-containing protein [Vibrio sp. T187]|uniref:CHASE4 domain-containing protein n=1 Tax=Vibrio TaxID=662 RepID=UPI0010CA1A94|nr:MULTISPECIES: CHASE4 domain-containing protein [Vibrio]MBW3696058.1 PAS domain-containing protein [Vibrio sp. T187]
MINWIPTLNKDSAMKWHHSIEKRLIIIFLMAMTLTFGVMTTVSVIVGSEERKYNETVQVEKYLQIALNLLKSKIDDVAVLATDYGEWDDTYHYMNAPTREFEQSSMDMDSLESVGLSGVILHQLDGEAAYKLSVYDYSTDSALWSLFKNMNAYQASETYRGAIFLQGRILVYVSHPITDNSGEAPTNGRITLVRELNQRIQESISKDLGESMNIVNMAQPDAVELIRFTGKWRVDKSEIVYSGNTLTGVYRLFLSDELPLPLLIELEVERTENHYHSVWRWLIPEVIMLVLLTVGLVFILRATVTKPIKHLIEWLNQVDGSQLAEDLKPFPHAQHGEIGILSNKFSDIYNNLYQQHQFSQLLLYSISDFIFTVDSQGRVDYCNPAAAEWLKIDSRQVYNQDFELLLVSVDENAPSVSNWLYRALETSSEYSGQVLIRKLSEPDKTYLVEVQVSPILNNDSDHKGAMIILRPKD